MNTPRTDTDGDVESKARAIASSYPIVIEACGSGFIGYTTILPGVVSHGATPAECIERVVDDQAMAIATMLEHDIQVPGEPRTEQLNLRLTSTERTLLLKASKAAPHRSISDFVRSAAIREAKLVVKQPTPETSDTRPTRKRPAQETATP